MKTFILTLCTACFLFIASNALALSFGSVEYYISSGDAATVYSGTYLFTSVTPGNDNPTTLSPYLSDFVGLINTMIEPDVGTFDLYDKLDAPATTGSDMAVTYYSGNKTGEWTTEDPVQFYTVKASTEFAVYWLDPASTFGYWSTEHLRNGGGNIPSISHLSMWNSTDEPPPVPEPATFILLGGGLVGLAFYRRRQK